MNIKFVFHVETKKNSIITCMYIYLHIFMNFINRNDRFYKTPWVNGNIYQALLLLVVYCNLTWRYTLLNVNITTFFFSLCLYHKCYCFVLNTSIHNKEWKINCIFYLCILFYIHTTYIQESVEMFSVFVSYNKEEIYT
jgi:hypothetical protein